MCVCRCVRLLCARRTANKTSVSTRSKWRKLICAAQFCTKLPDRALGDIGRLKDSNMHQPLMVHYVLCGSRRVAKLRRCSLFLFFFSVCDV